MAKVLYITANPKAVSSSNSLTVGEEFLTTYSAQNPGDVIERVDLFETDLQEIDGDIFSAWGKFAAGQAGELTAIESEKVERMSKTLDQFLEADKVVFVTPMWNFNIPSRVKTYIDNLCIPNKAFKYTEAGPVGLIKGKKALHIHASGGVHSHGPGAAMNFGDPFLKGTLGFIGLTDYTTVWVEGSNQFPGHAETIKAKAITEARELAETF